MKKSFFIAVPVAIFLACFSTAIVSAAGYDHMTIIATTDKVPDEVIKEFESTFVFDDEDFLIGARIDMLRPYLDSEEIRDLVKTYVNEKDLVYEGYKPKGLRGCKRNNRWVCVLRDIDAVQNATRKIPEP